MLSSNGMLRQPLRFTTIHTWHCRERREACVLVFPFQVKKDSVRAKNFSSLLFISSSAPAFRFQKEGRWGWTGSNNTPITTGRVGDFSHRGVDQWLVLPTWAPRPWVWGSSEVAASEWPQAAAPPAGVPESWGLDRVVCWRPGPARGGTAGALGTTDGG